MSWHLRLSKLSKRTAITSLAILVVAIAAIVSWQVYRSDRVGKATTAAGIAEQAAINKKALINSSTKKGSANANSNPISKLSPVVANTITANKNQVSAAVADKHFTAQQGKMIDAEIAVVQNYMETLGKNPTAQQLNKLQLQENVWEKWAIENNIPYHYIGPGVSQ